MSARTHAALWIVGIVVALVAVPLIPAEEGALALEARTQSLLARVDPRIAAAAASRSPAWVSPWAGAPTAERKATASLDAGFIRLLLPRWQATWRLAVFRLALVACSGVVWVPMVVAGAIDGLALRRARRSRLAAASPVALAAGGHALIALGFAPALWAALPLGAEPIALAVWALTTSATLSFTLSRTGAGGTP